MSDLSFILKPITNRGEANTFITLLCANNMLFHFEDDVDDILWGEAAPHLIREELDALKLRVDELYSDDLDWGEHDCPIGYALEVMASMED